MRLSLFSGRPGIPICKSFTGITVAFLFTIVGCSKTPHDINSIKDTSIAASLNDNGAGLSKIKVKVENNTLHFTDTATFLSDVETILAFSVDEFKQFEKQVGFKSLESTLHEAYQAFDGLRSNNDLTKWQIKYKGVAEWKDSTVTAVLQEDIYHRLVNIEGEYRVGDGVAKVTSEKVISVPDGDRSKLNRAARIQKSEPSQGILVAKLGIQQAAAPLFKSSAEAPARCGQTVLTKLQQQGDRKTWVTYYVTPLLGLYTVHTVARVRANGHKKTLFGWNKYKTKYRIENITFSILNARNEIRSYSDVAGGNGSDQYEYAISFPLGDETAFDKYHQPSGFIYAGARATSRGTSPWWAVVCCGTSCASNWGHYAF